MRLHLSVVIVSGCASALLTAGCGQREAAPSPVAPSVSTSTLPGGTAAASPGSADVTVVADGLVGKITSDCIEDIETVGIIASIPAGACPALQFTIPGYTVKTDASTAYLYGTCADLRAGVKVTVRGTRQADGTVVASKIIFYQSAPETVETEGIISSVASGAACPTAQFAIPGYTVKTDASTAYLNGTCADLRAGVKVTVRGTKANGTITATKVIFYQSVPESIETDGIISSVASGAGCPTAQFAIPGYTVKTDASTAYLNGTCADLRAGVKVTVRGTKANGVITATKVIFYQGVPETVETGGVISSTASGLACPVAQFAIPGYTVKTDGATVYLNGGCSDLRTGAKVTVRGTKANGIITAAKVIFDNTAPAFEEEGIVTAVASAGGCTTLQFSFLGLIVRTGASTQFAGGTCADVVVGTRVSVRGTRQADGTILAATIAVQDRQSAIEGEGIVSAVLDAGCPTAHFAAGGYRVRTDPRTMFVGGGCADLRAGARVSVRGAVLTDGAVLASRVGLQGAPNVLEGDGVVTAIGAGSACPISVFTVLGYVVRADASTQFAAGRCSDIAVGATVSVRGAFQGDGTVSALSISVRASANRAEGEGVVGQVDAGTACPTLQFTIDRYRLRVDRATRFTGGACGDLRTGARVAVSGSVQPDGAVQVLSIQFRN